jgi:glutathione S-transferase
MSDLILVIGSKVYSSWSLRPWLLLRHHNIGFKEITIPPNRPDTRKRILEHSPAGKVPVLKHGAVTVWESLAICEYLAESLKLAGAWPADPAARALARSLASEMHAGFADLRNELPMDCRRAPAPQDVSEAAAADIVRIRALWRECRQAHSRGGPWLFGKFGIVDAMFAPVALRFHSYAVALDGAERDYMSTVLNMPALREWLGAAMLEDAPAPAAKAEASTVPARPAPVNKARATPAAAPPSAAAAPKSSGKPDALAATRKQVVSQDGGVKVTSFIIPD